MHQWFIGLVAKILHNSSFRTGGANLLHDLANKFIEHKDNPDEVKALAGRIIEHKNALIGALAHGTPVESQAGSDAVKEAKDLAQDA